MSTRAHVRVGGAPGALELQLPAISLLVNDLAEIHRTAVAELAREVAKLMTCTAQTQRAAPSTYRSSNELRSHFREASCSQKTPA